MPIAQSAKGATPMTRRGGSSQAPGCREASAPDCADRPACPARAPVGRPGDAYPRSSGNSSPARSAPSLRRPEGCVIPQMAWPTRLNSGSMATAAGGEETSRNVAIVAAATASVERGRGGYLAAGCHCSTPLTSRAYSGTMMRITGCSVASEGPAALPEISGRTMAEPPPSPTRRCEKNLKTVH